ncbi:hypothetical protein KIN20_018633 [Parelaphostrongylus tenuis]|uniref:protein-tyrosine-phosphatase n=1 Tax=Parelaphostrongylus tenuis TaxID=148309 RepID=A0AAD5MJP8_PARTN|nr:hypothetical protein KIN20_018633 [Parelaphostrongylus tenuis]
MQKLKFTTEKAIELIKKSRPIVCPNEGFVAQLQIYEQLHYKTDGASLKESRSYRNWAISSGNSPLPGTNLNAGAFIKELYAERDSRDRGSKFRCGKCRQTLFFSEHLVPHKRSDGELCKFGYIVEPLNWMNVSEYEGKVNCPKCETKLGSYIWGGQQCHGESEAKCSQYVAPWVHLHRGKVDEIKVQSTTQQPQRPHLDVPSVVIS